MPKVKTLQKQRHDPLHVELSGNGDSIRKNKNRIKPEKEVKEEEFVDSKTSRRILQIAREQQEELDREEEEEEDDLEEINPNIRPYNDDEDDEEDEDQDAEEYNEDDVEDILIDEEDAAALEKFFPSAPRTRKTLADMIMEKIQEADGGVVKKTKENEIPMPKGIDDRVVEVYTKVGTLLSRYRSGKLPKAFKIIPSLRNWEEILYITRPEEWTPQATYEATRVFVSNLKAKQSQKFFNFVLLDKVRDDIDQNKKLNYHLYMALKKALYKPAAFFKGILFPLCESRPTLRESAIIASILVKVSIPVLHSSAALLKLAEMEYTGPTSLFIRVLLDKKYALPYKVIDALVFHFIRFRRDLREMPVLWQQSFLVFAQRYKSDLTDEQKQVLLETISAKHHHNISPEIRRELQNSVARGEALSPGDMEMDL